MQGGTSHLDQEIRRHLESFTDAQHDYWAFRWGASRKYAQPYFQYPAMMVPFMQGALLRSIIDAGAHVNKVFDPFVGSGTVLTEAMLWGLDFTGQDINPLAVLLCKAKCGPFHATQLYNKAEILIAKIRSDRGFGLEADFAGVHKWFSLSAAIELSRIRRAIRYEPVLWARRFFWVCLAECVRVTSNSRTSTFKLHIRPAKELEKGLISPFQVFRRIVAENLDHFKTEAAMLESKGFLRRGRYTGRTKVHLSDARNSLKVKEDSELFDLLITSPPYGDNKTTVPYGQHSYLPLQWIDLRDIDRQVDHSCLQSTHELDSRSLGGRTLGAVEAAQELLDISPTFRHTMGALAEAPRDRSARVAAFCLDLYRSLGRSLDRLSENAYMIWTLGNRRVGGHVIRMDTIVTEMLQSQGAILIHKIQRQIPTKRMAIKNRITETMRAETVLVLRKGSKRVSYDD